MVKLVLKYCDSKLTQNFYSDKTGFVRPGHILVIMYLDIMQIMYCN